MKRASTFTSVATLAVVLVLAAPSPGLGQAHGIPPLLCPEVLPGVPGQVFHMDKIIFTTVATAIVLCPAGTIDPPNAGPFQINFNKTMDIKVLDDPGLVADVRDKVAGFLNSLGCVNGAGTNVRWQQIDVIDVEYATACGLPAGEANSPFDVTLPRDRR